MTNSTNTSGQENDTKIRKCSKLAFHKVQGLVFFLLLLVPTETRQEDHPNVHSLRDKRQADELRVEMRNKFTALSQLSDDTVEENCERSGQHAKVYWGRKQENKEWLTSATDPYHREKPPDRENEPDTGTRTET